MIVFEAIDAGHGDCLLLRWTTASGRAAIMVIDGGPKSAGDGGMKFSPWRDRLSPRLAALKGAITGTPEDPLPGDARLPLSLVVCTHVDDDHIAGIDALYDCIVNVNGCGTAGPHLTAPRLWFNSFEAALGVTPQPPAGSLVAASIAQGASLTRNARRLPALRLNEGQGLIMDGQVYATQFRPLSITILNPRRKELDRLKAEWDAWEKRRKRGGALQAATLVDDAAPDQSIPNLSSIVLLVETPDGSLLLTGDQRSDHILDSLRTKGLCGAGRKLNVSILKVPHHGSLRNNQNAFYREVSAGAYVFCADGRNGNPDPPVLEMIAESRLGESYDLVFTAQPTAAYASGGSAFQDGFVAATLGDAIKRLRGKIASDGHTLLLDPARVSCHHRVPRELSARITMSGGTLSF